MKKFFTKIFRGLLRRRLEDAQEITHRTEPQEEIEQVSTLKVEKHHEEPDKKTVKTGGKKVSTGKNVVSYSQTDIRDIMELMEVPIVSLSKNRKVPIIYETPDGRLRVKISCHTEHYIASIYDWDIITLVLSKLQESMNNGLDIPPRTLIIPRHQLLKELRKHDGKKEEKDLKASLSRLKTTLVETTISNKDGRFDAGTGFLDTWSYTDRKDIKEFRITLSQWLYEVACRKGTLLKSDTRYFDITSGLKKFLYRTARKHVGTKNDSWEFSLETLYSRSGSEQEFKKFKYDIKKAVSDNDIPSYSMEWIEEDGKEKVRFINKKE